MLKISKYNISEAKQIFNYSNFINYIDFEKKQIIDIDVLKFIHVIEDAIRFERNLYEKKIKREIYMQLHNIFNYEVFGETISITESLDNFSKTLYTRYNLNLPIVLYD